MTRTTPHHTKANPFFPLADEEYMNLFRTLNAPVIDSGTAAAEDIPFDTYTLADGTEFKQEIDGTWTVTNPNRPKEIGGWKDDGGKARFDLIPSEFMFALAQILTFGAEKYGERNWEKGMNWSRPFGAAMRHLWSWWAGKGPTNINFCFGSLDEETGYSHLWHAAACVCFLVTFEERGQSQWDDRHE